VLGPSRLAAELDRLLAGEGRSAIAQLPHLAAVRATDMIVLDLPFGGQPALDMLDFWRKLPEDERPAVLSLYTDAAHRPLSLAVGDAVRVPYDPVEFKDRVIALSRWHASWRRAVTATRKLNEARALLRETEDRLTRLEARDDEGKSSGEVAAYFAHEVRTPLNAILGFSEILKDQRFGPLGDGRYAGYAADIHTAASHLTRVCEDAMSLAKLESGRDRLTVETVKVGEIFDRAVSMVQGLAETSGVRIKVEVDQDFPELRTDGSKLLQVVLNLTTNAIKFTPSGGAVKLKARLDKLRGAMVLVIRDSGIGMSPDDVSLAMRPFGQVGKSLGGRPQGAGLGLPLTRSLVERLGGQLEIVSQPGVGTVITVLLPKSTYDA
jgi:signal transduction histidine kinase